jgi:sigma-E factor negative regulatory protein RseA
MNTRPESAHDREADERNALISALADGDAAALDRGCELWRSDADARATWHAYHLIGDVMRSDDLAVRPARDQDFLASLRTRLADEPVLLAPAPVAPAATPRRRQRWLLPAAAAAGFVAVAGVTVVARMSADGAGGTLVATERPAAGPIRAVATQAEPRTRSLVYEGRFIRDAQLDAYLEAHRQAYGGRAATVPGGMPAYAEAVAPASAVQVAR